MFTGPIQARDYLMDYLYDRDEAIEDDVRSQLREYLKVISPVKMIIECIKLVYDRLPDCGPELRQWASDSAIMCVGYGFDQITSDMAETLKPAS